MKLFATAALLLLVLLMMGCDKINSIFASATSTTTTTMPAIIEQHPDTTNFSRNAPLPLSWEAGQPSRKAWSDFLYTKLAGSYFLAFDSATDAKRLCENYDALKLEDRAMVWAELFSAMSKYESNWDVDSFSIDVGQAGQKETYSVGLMQVSVTDQYGDIPKTYSFEDLQEPLPNLHLALEIMKRQLLKRHKIILDNSDSMRYWAVILDGNKYSKIKEIAAMVQKLPMCQKNIAQ